MLTDPIMKLSKNTMISGLKAFSKEEIIRFLTRAFRPQQEKEAEALGIMKTTRGKRAWEFWAETGATHVQMSDGAIREVPKKLVVESEKKD